MSTLFQMKNRGAKSVQKKEQKIKTSPTKKKPVLF